MSFNGSLKNSSFILQLMGLLSLVFVGIFVSSIIFFIYSTVVTGTMPGFDFMSEMTQKPSMLRAMQFFTSLGTFLFPALIFSWFVSDNWKKYLMIDDYIPLNITLLVILSMLVIIPFLNWMASINQQLVFPEFLKGFENTILKMEENNNSLLKIMLSGNNISVLIFNVLLVGVIAGVGEEFLFRGVLQNIFGKLTKNPHLIIWSVAFIFSFIHLQFFTFLPRLLLGAYFGYLLLWTKNLWIPVIAHFTNNAVGVLTCYFIKDPVVVDKIDAIGTGDNWWSMIISLFVFGILVIVIFKLSRQFLITSHKES